MSEDEGKYWIQEQAPSGNFYDSIGLDSKTTEEEAMNTLEVMKRNWGPFHNFRLVIRKDTVVG